MRVLAGVLVVAAAAAAASLAPVAPANAASNASGDLVAGGTAHGDISRTAGETDSISVTLIAGEKVDVAFTATFAAKVRLVDPSNAAVTIGMDATSNASAHVVANASGRHRFSISSADGTQGRYTLIVKPRWDKTLVKDVSGDATIDVPMPAGGSLSATARTASAGATPTIASLRSPTGAELLAAPIVGAKHVATMPLVACPDAGTYALAASTAPAGAYRVTLHRKTPKVALTTISLTNGLDAGTVTFAKNGIGSFMSAHCAHCHDWAGSYSGVRSMGSYAYSMMAAGYMPLGGSRVSSTFLDKFSTWMSQGYPQ